jgi:2-haloacid dehalogenase
MGDYRDFWELTERALDAAFALVPSADRAMRQPLLDAYWKLDCYPEVPKVLKDLKANGARLAILSNGSPAMLESAVKNAALDTIIDEIFSVDRIRRYKPHPDVYDMVTTQWRLYPSAISFQSSNRWDAAGAARFGYRTIWINRSRQPNEYPDHPAKLVLPSLEGLITAS